MKVLKFGGSSVAKPDRVAQVLNILANNYQQGTKFTVVFSAFGGVTDSLIEMSELAAQGDENYIPKFEAFVERHIQAAKELIPEDHHNSSLEDLKDNHEALKKILYGIHLVQEVSPRTMDHVLSFGERNSAYIISRALKAKGIDAGYLDARKIIKTDKNFGAARVDQPKTFENIRRYFADHPQVQIVTGFIASEDGGLTTTLGRGGSDYTASLLGAGLSAEKIEIWTDVDGVLTADPRKVKSAFTIPRLTYMEAMEMSHFGAKVIYPPTLQPALKAGIPLVIKNTFNPDHSGTYISKSSGENGHIIKGISSISSIALLTLQGSGLFGVPGISGRLFSALAQAGINVIMITQGSSEHSISFAIAPEKAIEAKHVVEDAFAYERNLGVVDPIKVETDLSTVAVIGENMRYQPGIAGRLFQALGKNGVNCVAIAQGSSELNVSVVVPNEDESKALNSLHEAFFLSNVKELNLFIVGVGLIGSTLIDQIKKQKNFIEEKHSMRLKIIGLANSRQMLFDPQGVNPDSWKDALANGEPMSMSAFLEKMTKLNLSNSIFVDNTASDKVTSFYESILDESISISTANKIATSSGFIQYKRLKNIADKRGVQFHYETNVGAGLPVINTLNDLLISGDKILKIEGVLSGSLSFIFNTFGPGKKFSEVVLEAKDRGYTEPDPRIDLNGIDVRRKLIILAREAGLKTEAGDVEIEYILSEQARNAKSLEDFFELLPGEDQK
ncbi:MAG: bifunctional aspartate kinase/homoserine dehydrogenase I, partial [Saprospiraceae bacterium]|nr:bifunctional aspartate kinase/homoserine dehydrogenase I [Saprospiraceae bacterium]